ncbi:CRISPR-associated protein Cas2 [Thioalkalivibrio nitratireducens DSM 14787]|uniref:CRISPR-associated endoribonuclease Cas2 n=1 Tax=Thioalkalivibrio nitratireducens (strain DSM 14787 / UNIQEM 213 / ALEN2) TaxID=1255043 RepID=L0DVU6_THIND|nr:CRISPR-associated endonuclease Cas2 [Thioalkalivibrio nitratireducens]AGA33158.1 CRISPR-associated protein Cas2 [Thioalkalivibrio nitratireducens DSM 14787]
MALNAPRAWLICYDIADPRRLIRLHRFLKRFAQPVQYSVFYYEGSSAQLARCLHDIAGRIDHREDDVRAYPIPNPAQVDTLGRGALPDGALLQSHENPGLVTLLQALAE